MSDSRQRIRSHIDEALKAGARLAPACQIIGISSRTYQRWQLPDNVSDGRLEPCHEPPNKLSELERQRLLKVANCKEYAHLPPSKIVPLLANQGLYLASESTFYRVLKAANQLTHRQRSKPPRTKPRAWVATSPNQVYSWDITYLPTLVRGLFLYLYVVMDIYSRKIVGWQVHERESAELAADLMTDICLREGVKRDQVVLHSDNGGPMKGATLLVTLQQLGVIASFSRPSVSNDNPYSESLFRTLKYLPTYPVKPFADVADARSWMVGFVDWYNTEHLHSGIKFVTPQQRHQGLDKDILAKRHEVYQRARAEHSSRWSGDTRDWSMVTAVYLNPEPNTNKAA